MAEYFELASVGDLRALSNSESRSVARVRGTGWFERDDADTETTDDGVLCVVDVSLRRWIRTVETLVLPIYTLAELELVDPTAGLLVHVSDGDAPIAVGDGTDWLYPDATEVEFPPPE